MRKTERPSIRYRRSVPARTFWLAGVASLAAASLLVYVMTKPVQAAGVPYAVGDVFIGAGSGTIYHYDPTGVLKDTLLTTDGNFYDTGMCFDSSGNLYGTNFSNHDVSKWDNMGNLVAAHWASGLANNVESCVRDSSGHIYVGGADANTVYKFDTSGTLLATYTLATGPRGTDWIELAADQCTLLYTSEGDAIKSLNVCTNTQNADVVTGLSTFAGSSDCFALRVLPNGEVLVACDARILRLDSSGALLATYQPGGGGEFFFSINLDPDGVTFWSAGLFSSSVYRINIATGAVVTTFTSTPVTFNAGVAVYGEKTAGGGGVVTGRMNGGGGVSNGSVRYTFGTQLHCAAATPPNNLEINWGTHKFHLESLTSATCTDNPNITSNPPRVSFDTISGDGTGRCDGAPATITFTLADAGDPGRNDTASFTIVGCGGTFTASGKLSAGNLQALP
jgi:hypothetical protein